MLKKISLAVALILVGIIGITLIALESGNVIVVETVKSEKSEDGQARFTRVWFVREQTTLYLEAGHPDNPWVTDLAHNSSIRLKGSGIDGSYHFTVHADAESHQKIRELMRGKYGWRDVWISTLFDVSQSQLVELSSTAAP